jgi:hypothetical protein
MLMQEEVVVDWLQKSTMIFSFLKAKMYDDEMNPHSYIPLSHFLVTRM